MDFKQLQTQFTQQVNLLNQKFNAFFNFIINKLKNFKNLTLGEQIAYCVVGAGLLLIIVSIILFIL